MIAHFLGFSTTGETSFTVTISGQMPVVLYQTSVIEIATNTQCFIQYNFKLDV